MYYKYLSNNIRNKLTVHMFFPFDFKKVFWQKLCIYKTLMHQHCFKPNRLNINLIKAIGVSGFECKSFETKKK